MLFDPAKFEEKSNLVTSITSNKSNNQSYKSNPSYFVNAAIKLLLHRPNLAHQVDESILNELENIEAATLRDSIIPKEESFTHNSFIARLLAWHNQRRINEKVGK